MNEQVPSKELVDFLIKWANLGLLQTYESRTEFRREAYSWIGRLERAENEPPAVQSKIAARDVHYRLIEEFRLADDPSANAVVRGLLEQLAAGSAQPPGVSNAIDALEIVERLVIEGGYQPDSSVRNFLSIALSNLRSAPTKVSE